WYVADRSRNPEHREAGVEFDLTCAVAAPSRPTEAGLQRSYRYRRSATPSHVIRPRSNPTKAGRWKNRYRARPSPIYRDRRGATAGTEDWHAGNLGSE